MKITKATIKRFEDDQEKFSTGVAIHNVIIELVMDILKDIGIKSLKIK